MTEQAEYERLNEKFGRFTVTRYDKNRLKYVPISGQQYPRIQDALAAAKRLEGGKRYAGQFLYIDIAFNRVAA